MTNSTPAPTSTRRGRLIASVVSRPITTSRPRHGRRIEAGAAIADEHLDALAGELGVNGDRLLPGELRGVEHRLASSCHHGATALIERAVAHSHDLDRAPRHRLDLRGCRLEGRGETVTGLA